jgi:hypothetical protein
MPAVPSGSAGQSAVHTLTSTMSGGATVVISKLDGQSTSAIPEAATGAEVAAAINQALGQNPGAITGTGASKGPWVITVPPNLVGPLNANVAFTCTVTGSGAVTDVVTTEATSFRARARPHRRTPASSGRPVSPPTGRNLNRP